MCATWRGPVLTDKVVDGVDVCRSGSLLFEVAGALVAEQVGMLGGPNELSFNIPPASVGRVQKPSDAGVFGLLAKRSGQELTHCLRQFRKVGVVRGENKIRL